MQKGLPRLLLIALQPRRVGKLDLLVSYKTLARICKPTKKGKAVEAAADRRF